MKNLYIYAYPAQMLTFQLVKDNQILTNENCSFEDNVRMTAKYLKEEPIDSIFIIGDTPFADKIGTMLHTNFEKRVKIERIKNA